MIQYLTFLLQLERRDEVIEVAVAVHPQKMVERQLLAGRGVCIVPSRQALELFEH